MDLGGDGNLLGGAAELFEDVLQAAAVVGEQEGVRHGERFAGGLRGDEGVAVAVASDPGAEADELREVGDGVGVCWPDLGGYSAARAAATSE